ncbi:Hypothetical predicted protein [Octopus vulgaris]|uniref:Uncharacterized protein n=1 Tax=Octopus vulgaris TaxID=6645 RepID=A0AA36BUM0_OCTVU|nr:Hypothetical predicted protein [Octopus vulgaris]
MKHMTCIGSVLIGRKYIFVLGKEPSVVCQKKKRERERENCEIVVDVHERRRRQRTTPCSDLLNYWQKLKKNQEAVTMKIELWIGVFPWLCILASSTSSVVNNTDNELGPLRNVCVSTISHTVTYLERVYFTRIVHTRKCKLIVFCKTVYSLQRLSRLERRTKIIYRMKAHCCKGFTKKDNLCISTNSSYFPRYGEVSITSGSSMVTKIAVVVSAAVAACLLAAIIVACRRRKKAANSPSEIPCDREVLALPPNSRNNCWDLPEGLSCNVAAPDENYYVSMNNGFTSDTPNVNRMLSTRGSRYRFDDLEEGNCGGRTRGDTLYVLPDPKFGQGNAKTCRIREEPEQNCGSSSDIYVNERPESSEGTSANNDNDDIYSEIKSSTNNTSQPLHYATYEDINQDNKTDVNGNGRGGRGKDGSGRSDKAKGEFMELTDLAKTKNEDTYNVPKSRSKFNNQKSSDDRGDDTADGGGAGAGDDRKNNNGDDDSIEGSRSKTCDSGIYIYLNSKEEDDEQEDESDIIYSVPYSNSNNNNSNNNNSNCNNNNNSPSHSDCIKCPDTRQPRKQRRAAVVQSHVYQNAMFDGEEAGHSNDVAKTNAASSLSSSPSPSLSSSSSLQQWQNEGMIYRNVADDCCDDQTLYQDIDNTKNEVHV